MHQEAFMKLVDYLALCIMTLLYSGTCTADNGAILKEKFAKIIQQQEDGKQQHNGSVDAFAGDEDDEEDPSLLASMSNKIAIEARWIKNNPGKALTTFGALCGAIGLLYGAATTCSWAREKWSDWRVAGTWDSQKAAEIKIELINNYVLEKHRLMMWREWRDFGYDQSLSHLGTRALLVAQIEHKQREVANLEGHLACTRLKLELDDRGG